MRIDGVSYTDSSAFAPPVQGQGDELGKEAFLNLLVAQLQNQDPLDPADNTEFVSQLAQFSSLEGITNMGTKLDTIGENITAMNNYSSSNLIGKNVTYKGNSLDYYGGGGAPMGYSLDSAATSVKVVISNANGVPVNTFSAPEVSAGDHSLIWDGTDYNGLEVPAGRYTFSIEAEGTDGVRVGSTPYVVNSVSGITFKDGQAYLLVGDEEVSPADVKEIF